MKQKKQTPVIPINERRIKVVTRTVVEHGFGAKNRYYASLTLTGRWMEKAGFPVGRTAIVKIEHHKLTIIPADPDETPDQIPPYLRTWAAYKKATQQAGEPAAPSKSFTVDHSQP